MPVNWTKDGSNRINIVAADTLSSRTGDVEFLQEADGVVTLLRQSDAYSPGINVPFNIASRHGSTFVNGATDGTAVTADTTITAIPDLSETEFGLGHFFMGTISELRVWPVDITDIGIAAASAPSLEPSLSILSLFANNQQGVWFDPSDISTLFQDSNGTTPVTASGQPVGKILDKSGNGNHATQGTASKRPTYTEGGGLSWLAFDGVDDNMEVADVSGMRQSIMTFFIAI